MALICDTGAVYALHDADDAEHTRVKAIIEAEPGPLLLPVILLAEIAHFEARTNVTIYVGLVPLHGACRRDRRD